MNTKRVKLGERLPLRTPFSVHIFPIFYCNFRCGYCLHSLSDEKLKEMDFKRGKMSMETYKNAIDGIAVFPDKLKALLFAGHGEPLLHDNISEMVRYAKEKDIAERIEIVTNGSLLTDELSDKLIDAGLDRLRVSLQGLTSEKYKEVSDVELNVNDLIKHLEYFCSKKKSTEVYVKIMDISMDSPADFVKFKEMFVNACDISAVEYAIPFVSEVDYSRFGELSQKCKQGNVGRSEICSMPFYMLVVYPDGSILPCCATKIPIKYQNVNDVPITDIWNGMQHIRFLEKQLGGVKNIAVCKDCSVPSFGLQEGDYLDNYKEILQKKYSDIGG